MRHLAWYSPALYGFLVILVLQYSGADAWLAGQIYQLDQGWNWRNSWLLETVFHKGGRNFVALYLSALLLLTVLSFASKLTGKTQRVALLYAVCASLLSILLISGLKQITMLPCPWDVKEFGGTQPYLYLHQLLSTRESGPQCFPAGHASGGYALFSLYFGVKMAQADKSKPLSLYWLLPALLVGGLFGVAQQLRGAHFLSHDLTSALLCWVTCFVLWRAFTYCLIPAQARSQYIKSTEQNSIPDLTCSGK